QTLRGDGPVTNGTVLGRHRAIVRDNGLALWDTATGQLIARLVARAGFGDHSVVLDEKAGRVIAGVDNDLLVWNTDGIATGRLRGHASVIQALATLPNDHLVSASRDTTVKVWDLRQNALAASLEGHTSSVLAIAVSRDGQLIATGSNDNTIRIWD